MENYGAIFYGDIHLRNTNIVMSNGLICQNNTITMANCLIFDNNGSEDGALFVNVDCTAYNTIFARNSYYGPQRDPLACLFYGSEVDLVGCYIGFSWPDAITNSTGSARFCTFYDTKKFADKKTDYQPRDIFGGSPNLDIQHSIIWAPGYTMDYFGPVNLENSIAVPGYTGPGVVNTDPLLNDQDQEPIGEDEVWWTGDETFIPTADSPGIDQATISDLPLDELDVDGDGNTTEPLPWDLYRNHQIGRASCRERV